MHEHFRDKKLRMRNTLSMIDHTRRASHYPAVVKPRRPAACFKLTKSQAAFALSMLLPCRQRTGLALNSVRFLRSEVENF